MEASGPNGVKSPSFYHRRQLSRSIHRLCISARRSLRCHRLGGREKSTVLTVPRHSDFLRVGA